MTSSPLVRGPLVAVLAVLLPIAVIGSFLIGAEPARAESCSEATGSDHDSLIKADNTVEDATGWNCAYVFTTGDDEIDFGATEIQESTTGLGYQKVFDCQYQSGDVGIIGPTVIDGGGKAPSSATWSATNGSTGDRHYVVAALWNTTTNSRYPYAGQYNDDSNCTDYDIPFNEVYTTSIDWSYTGAGGGAVPTNEPWPVTITLKPSNGKVISDDTVYMKVSFRDDTTSDDTIVGYGLLNKNVANASIYVPKAGTWKLWPVYPGINLKKAQPPSTNTTPVDGSCFGGQPTCPDGNVIQSVTFADSPRYTPTLTASFSDTTVPGSTSVDAKINLTIPAGAASWPNNPPQYAASVTLRQQMGSSPAPSTDPTVWTGNFPSIGPGSYSMDAWFISPKTQGNYKYYANFGGYPANPSSAYNGVNGLQSTPVPLTTTAVPSSCAAMTGGTTNTYIKANNDYTDSRGYNCAYLDDTGPIQMSARQVLALKFTSAKQYQAVATCETPTQAQAFVTVTSSPTDGGGSGPSTAYWQISNTTSSSSTQPKAYASALWMVRTNSTTPYPNNYNGTNCDSTTPGKPVVIQPNLLHMMSVSMGKPTGTVAQGSTSTWPVSLTSIDGYTVNGATVNIMQMQGSTPSSADDSVGKGTVNNNAASVSVTPGAGPLNFYAVLVGSNYVNPTLPSTGWTASQSNPVDSSGGAVSASAAAADSRNAVNPITPEFTPLPSPKVLDRIDLARHAEDKRAAVRAQRESILERLLPTQVYVVEKSGKGKMSASCPTGTGLYTFATSAPHATYGPGDFSLSPGQRGISFKAQKGGQTRFQVTCRPIASPMSIKGKLGRGSVKGDQMRATLPGSIFTGGPGDDDMWSQGARTALDGGLGADRLRLLGARSSGNGGFGPDRLYSNADGTVLVGGPGRDIFRTGSGRVLVNARDGKGGDTVSCGSSATKVIVDSGDVINGPCSVVK